VKFHNNQCKSIATSAQYVILEKYFSHPSLVIQFFGTPPMRLFLSDWKEMQTTNSDPPGPIIMIGQSKTGSSNEIILITLFSRSCTALLCFLPASAN
jgi:hypothetical protein